MVKKYVLQLDIVVSEFCVFILAIELTEASDSLYRSYQGWLLTVLLHVQLMERSVCVHGGSVRDARVQR